MIKFECDYQEGCHPRILERLTATNLEQTSGYGSDSHCERAKELIREAVGKPDAEVHLLVGGTQTNTTVIKSLLGPCDGVVCVSSGHINVHESGAIESTGHKVLAIPGVGGLMDAQRLADYLDAFCADETREHMVQPGMVYISHPSEYGTLYTKKHLQDIKAVCAKHGLPLFMDGARLGYGITADGTDVDLRTIAEICDVFYIGGTKVGALFGEAVVFPKKDTVKNFRTLIKQQGGLLAKGRLLGIQFETLFEDGLYMKIARNANVLAARICSAFRERGIEMLIESVTNQQFPILTDAQAAALREDFSFELWEHRGDGRSAYRFCTSWATLPENVEILTKKIKNI